ncbi:aspartate kinase [Halalkalibacter hemicellulosilyticus]|uniref:Aspartokinase n=1 Tax=Halalkalibacter hemicellulosilyticusJCM 9152 TaxID=1236971 RepID=W4QC93_9BACI|nr:aspartate kinase [Halalkalibacter hemicellulosilyticus]GAE29303.1 aspartokinase [Halalkalibacter hemicellulosilyticusJCM 9152]
MKVIVQKFGGTSVRDLSSRQLAADHVSEAVNKGFKVIVVVSAMGRKGEPYATDTLLNLIDTKRLLPREQDLLVSCGELISAVVFTDLLRSLNIKATAFSGAKAGFQTNDEFTNAKIMTMDCDNLIKQFELVDVVVVAGFQGTTVDGDIATLGRGGSDTSATALGAAVKAEWVDIFSDVEGIMTADPKVVQEAKPLHAITYEELSNLAYQGAKVIHPRAVEIAMQAQVPIHIRSTYSKQKGTTVTTKQQIRDRLITGIAHRNGVSQLKVSSKDGEFDFQEIVFKTMAKAQISIDFINMNPHGVVYTVSEQEVDRAISELAKVGYTPDVVRYCAKVSAVGAGMAGVPGVTAQIVSALSQENIQILQSADSHTTIWVLVKEKDLTRAVNALHRIFQLDQLEHQQGVEE